MRGKNLILLSIILILLCSITTLFITAYSAYRQEQLNSQIISMLKEQRDTGVKDESGEVKALYSFISSQLVVGSLPVKQNLQDTVDELNGKLDKIQRSINEITGDYQFEAGQDW